MEPGKKYRVRYKSQGGNGRWYEKEFVGLYLGHNETLNEEQFSLRPLAGTSSLSNHAEILETIELQADAQVRLPARVR